MKLRYHYTTGERLKDILLCGYIKPATDQVPKGERPVTWFSAREDWEPTANKSISDGFSFRHLTMEETEELGEGLARIGVLPHVAPMTWRVIRQKAKMIPKHADALERVGIRQGSNPADWYGTFQKVRRHNWRCVQVRSNGEWLDSKE